MKLPFLKERHRPKIAKPMEERLINGSADDHLEHHCVQELMDAVESKDIHKFRKALEALTLNMFDHEGKDDE